MLYTRKGDKGYTSFFGSKKRTSKTSCQTEALGALDEINTLLGVCRAKAGDTDIQIKGKSIQSILEKTQQNLFIIQAAVAGANKKLAKHKIEEVEDIIDFIEKELPPITTFFLPGGTEFSAQLDYARAVSRRAERRVVEQSKHADISPEILQYLNRLSSLLYALVRIVNSVAGTKETPPTYE